MDYARCQFAGSEPVEQRPAGRVLSNQAIMSNLLLQAPHMLAHAGVQPRLITRWREVHEASSGRGNAPKVIRHSAAEEGAFETPEQRTFFGLCASYKDIFFPLRPYPTRCPADFFLTILEQTCMRTLPQSVSLQSSSSISSASSPPLKCIHATSFLIYLAGYLSEVISRIIFEIPCRSINAQIVHEQAWPKYASLSSC